MKRPLFGRSSFLIFPERFYSLLRNLFLAAPFKYVTEGLSKMKRKPCFAIEKVIKRDKSHSSVEEYVNEAVRKAIEKWKREHGIEANSLHFLSNMMGNVRLYQHQLRGHAPK